MDCILLIRIAFCHEYKNLPLRCLFYVTMNICFCFYFYTARDVVTVLLILIKIYHLIYTCSHKLILSFYLHIFTRTYKGTHTQAHMYDQHTRGMATTRHRSLVRRSRRKAFVIDKDLTHESWHKTDLFKSPRTRNRQNNVSKPISQI